MEIQNLVQLLILFQAGWKRWGPDFTVDCPTTTTTPGPPIINPSVSNTRDECSGLQQLIHFNMANSTLQMRMLIS